MIKSGDRLSDCQSNCTVGKTLMECGVVTICLLTGRGEESKNKWKQFSKSGLICILFSIQVDHQLGTFSSFSSSYIVECGIYNVNVSIYSGKLMGNEAIFSNFDRKRIQKKIGSDHPDCEGWWAMVILFVQKLKNCNWRSHSSIRNQSLIHSKSMGVDWFVFVFV